jgi:hypothetical protein
VQAGVTSRAVLSVLVLPLDTIRVRDQKAPPPPFPSSSPGFVPAELSEEARPTVKGLASLKGHGGTGFHETDSLDCAERQRGRLTAA